MSLSARELKRFGAELLAHPVHWAQHVRHLEDVRVYEQIWDDEQVNAWVICWSEQQDTGFHDHDVSAAVIAVVSGHVREERLRVDGRPLSLQHGAGSVFTVPPVAIHRMRHAGGAPAVTLHAYSPPLTRTGAYRTGPDGVLQREALPMEQELRPQAALL